MFKKILFCIAVITCPALDLKAGEVTLREPEQVVTPIITHDERLILGASFSHTKYQDFSFGEVEFKEVFDRMDDSEWKKHPEYVLYRTYQYLREGKAEDLYSIWDPVYSRETISGGVEGLQERVSRENEFVEYGEVELTGKARFGPFVRLDHEVVMRTPQGQLSRATAFYYIQHDKRFFQTKLVGRTHLFGIIVDLAIQGEQEHHVALDDQFEEANELKITVDEARLSDEESEWMNYFDVTGQHGVDVRGEHAMSVFHTFDLVNWRLDEDPGEQMPNEYAEILQGVANAYESGEADRILELWHERDREGERRSIKSLKERGMWPESTGALIREDTRVVTWAETDSGVIVIFEGGRSGTRYALYLTPGEDGQLRLSRYLGNTGFDRLFLKVEFVDELVEQLERNAALE